jgi:hypothetical protein
LRGYLHALPESRILSVLACSFTSKDPGAYLKPFSYTDHNRETIPSGAFHLDLIFKPGYNLTGKINQLMRERNYGKCCNNKDVIKGAGGYSRGYPEKT